MNTTFKCHDCRKVFYVDLDAAIECRDQCGYPYLICHKCYFYSETGHEPLDTDFLQDWDQYDE